MLIATEMEKLCQSRNLVNSQEMAEIATMHIVLPNFGSLGLSKSYLLQFFVWIWGQAQIGK